MSLMIVLSFLACAPSDAPTSAMSEANARAYTSAWTTASGPTGFTFGWAVGGVGDMTGDGVADVLVGAPTGNDFAPDGGGVQFFQGGSSFANTAVWANGRNGALLGYSIADAGDINADGYADAVVGAPGPNGHPGSIVVYYGGASVPTLYTEISGLNTGENFGIAVVGAGDLNGDGYADVVVGASGMVTGSTGAISVFRGSASGLSDSPSQVLTGNVAYGGFGAALSAGDVDGDGKLEVLVGEPNYGNGYVHVYRSDSNGDLALTTSVYDNVEPSFGTAIAATDTNGDGYDDVVVGSPGASWRASGGGRAQLLLGAASGLSQTAAWIHDGDQSNEQLGHAVAAVGDLEGDGFQDVAVGSPYHNTVFGITGSVFVIPGAPRGVDENLATRLDGAMDGSTFGWSVSGGGDYDLDGRPDVIVGAPNENGSNGAMYIYGGYAQDDDQDGFSVLYDCNDLNASVGDGPLYFQDGDSDGFGSPFMSLHGCNGAPAGFVDNQGDCDDTSAFVYPGQAEYCDGVDQNCNNVVDEGLGLATYYDDQDGDGYGDDATAVEQCGPNGRVDVPGDCDDANSGVNPGASEIVSNGTDDDCNPDTPDSDGDIDDDGISDEDENALGLDPLSADSDDDGRSDADEIGSVGDPRDSDGDTVFDAIDEDDDGDEIPSAVEGWDTDTDGDGVLNPLDLDSDADGSADQAEGSDDGDADGIPDFLDAGSVTREEPPDAPKLCGTATAPAWLGFAASALLFRRRRSR